MCVHACVRARARASAATVVFLLVLLQAPHQCPAAVVEFEVGPANGRGAPVAKLFPVDVLAVFRLAARPDGSADVDGGAAGAEIDHDAGICENDFAFVHAYSFVFADGSGTRPPSRMFYTHQLVQSWDYVYLSDVYELLPVNRLLRPALLMPNPTQTSERDLTQYGEDSRRVSQQGRTRVTRPHYLWYRESL